MLMVLICGSSRNLLSFSYRHFIVFGLFRNEWKQQVTCYSSIFMKSAELLGILDVGIEASFWSLRWNSK
jgi:hypothetical protein